MTKIRDQRDANLKSQVQRRRDLAKTNWLSRNLDLDSYCKVEISTLTALAKSRFWLQTVYQSRDLEFSGRGQDFHKSLEIWERSPSLKNENSYTTRVLSSKDPQTRLCLLLRGRDLDLNWFAKVKISRYLDSFLEKIAIPPGFCPGPTSARTSARPHSHWAYLSTYLTSSQANFKPFGTPPLGEHLGVGIDGIGGMIGGIDRGILPNKHLQAINGTRGAVLSILSAVCRDTLPGAIQQFL
ncbi:hypothetical protein K438DRAFT_1769066 [Mycena galopus ATCC 62051]|nr:hypothetical protein K438DRAFT_1769066 [Mycena galopus ATCC 62051]